MAETCHQCGSPLDDDGRCRRCLDSEDRATRIRPAQETLAKWGREARERIKARGRAKARGERYEDS